MDYNDPQNKPDYSPEPDSYGVKLHFQLLEAKMDDFKDEIKDIREFIRQNRIEFNARMDKLDTKIWGIIILLPTSAGVASSDVISKFLG